MRGFISTKGFQKIFAVLFWIVLWQALSMKIGSVLLLPSPLDTAFALIEICLSLSFWKSVGYSVSFISTGVLGGFITGLATAILAYRFELIKELLIPPVTVIRATPVASFIILLLLWIPSQKISLPITFMMSFPIIYTSALTGLQSADVKLLEMAKVFSLPPITILKAITLPSAIPFILTGIRSAVGLSFKAGVAAEIIGYSSFTLGGELFYSKLYLEIARMFAVTVVIISISKLIEWMFTLLIKRVRKGGI